MHRSNIRSAYAPHLVDFNRMTPAAQARFVACTRQKAAPNYIIASKMDAPGTLALWLVAAAVSLAAMFALAYVGFGELTVGHDNQGTGFYAAYAVLGALFCFAVASAARVFMTRGLLPYSPGVYLFPIDLVDARTSHIRLVPLSELKSATVEESGNKREAVLHFIDGATFRFALRPSESDAIDDLNRMRSGVESAIEHDDAAMLEQLDCFFEERRAEGWKALAPQGASTPVRRPIPGIALIVPIAALVVGPLVGRAFWSLRNDASDRKGLAVAAASKDYKLIDAYLDGGGRLKDEGDTARFEAAKDQGSPDLTRQTLEHYIHHGTLHVDEADDLYFERAKSEASLNVWKGYLDNGKRHVAEADDAMLEAAKTAGTPEAFDIYLTVGTKHVEDVKRKWKPLAALHIAERSGSLPGMRAVLADAKDPEVIRAAKDAIHVKFEQARSAYEKRMKASGKVSAELIDRILASAEAGKQVALRLRQFPAKDLAGADESLVSENRGRGVRASDYFSAPHDDKRQAAIAHFVRMIFNRDFGTDIIDVDSSDADVADGQPVVEIGCEYAPDGHYVYKLEKGVFMSVKATCDGALKISGGGAEPLRFRTKFSPNRLKFTGAAVAGNVYEGMMDELPESIAEELWKKLSP